MKLFQLSFAASLLFLLTLPHTDVSAMSQSPKKEEVRSAVAVIRPTPGNSTGGVVRFEQEGTKVVINGRIEGLRPNSLHAIHIHEFGDATAPDAMSAGSHYNPEGHDHGLPHSEMRHAGDFGNLQANASGVAEISMDTTLISINGHHNPVLGRAVIIHAEEDDGGQPVGNAGPRIGIGVIGIAQP